MAESEGFEQIVACSKQIYQADLSFLRELDDRYSTVPGMEATQTLVAYKQDGRRAEYLSNVAPTPALDLLHAIFTNLTWDPDLKKDAPIEEVEPPAALCQFVGNVLLPHVGLSGDITGPECQIVKGNLEACEKAENYLNDCVTQLNIRDYISQKKISAYINAAGEIIGLRKLIDDCTMVTLIDMHAGNFPIPAGTIVKPTRSMNNNKQGEVRLTGHKGSFTVATYKITDVPQFAVGRISAAAFDREARQQFAVSAEYPFGEAKIDDERLAMLKHLDIAALKHAAEQIVALCDMQQR